MPQRKLTLYHVKGNEVDVKRAEQPRIKYGGASYRWEHQSGAIDGVLVAFYQEMKRDGKRVYFQYSKHKAWYSIDASIYHITNGKSLYFTTQRGEALRDVQDARSKGLSLARP